MFETEASPRVLPTVLRYLFQLLLSYPAVILAVLPVSGLLSLAGIPPDRPANAYYAGYDALGCLFLGPVIGLAIGRKFLSLRPTGRWIWVFPAIVLLPGMLAALLRSAPWLPEMLFASGSNEGLAVFLFTLPACSAVGYSIGMALASSKLRPHAIAITMVWLALLIPLIVVAWRFENAHTRNWSRIRIVIDRPGLWLSRDPDRICAAPISKTGLLLPTATRVERLERRVCFGGRLLAPGAPTPAGAWSVERVRVLDDSKPATEGWVRAYGLRELAED